MEHKLKFKRIGIVYVGGLARRFRSASDFGHALNAIHEWRMLGKLEPYLAPGRWDKAVGMIVASWKKCDGYVVIAPSQDFSFIAHCIAMMLGNVGKPIIYVGSDPRTAIDDIRFRAQLINSLQTVTQDISGHMSIHAHVAVPLHELFQEHPRTIFGYFDFGFRLSPRAPHRTSVFPRPPRLKALARIAYDDSKLCEARILTRDMGASPVPALICDRLGVRLRIADTVYDLPQQHPDIVKAQFVWAVQKAFEAGDFSDLLADVRTSRIDISERL